jgi:cytochrome c biogenesis protein CcmG/thiol:disulfide interchange protein DsbE
MSTRLIVVAGLLAGLLVGALGWAALVALGPVASPPPTAAPSLDLPTLPPSATPPPASATAAPSGSGAGSPPASVSGSPTASGSASAPASGSPAILGVGDPAPPLRVPQLGGGTIDLAALRGKPVWVYFMATWCPSCRDELPVMNGLAARYEKDGLVVLVVDVREDEAQVSGFASSLDLAMPVGLDGDGAAQQAWRAAVLPVHFWVDATGVVRDAALGGIGPDQMAAGLGRIMPGVKVTP